MPNIASLTNWEYRNSGYIPGTVVHDNQCMLWEVLSYPQDSLIKATLLKSKSKQTNPVIDSFTCEDVRPIRVICPTCKNVYENILLDPKKDYKQFTCVKCNTTYKFSTSKVEFIGKGGINLEVVYVPLAGMYGMLSDVPIRIKQSFLNADRSGFGKIIVNTINNQPVETLQLHEELGVTVSTNSNENVEIYEMKDRSWGTLDGRKMKILTNSYVRNPSFRIEV